jgi:lysophospholipid acyltransferase (LPLAT)-like uncharacterized protein
VKIRNPRLIRAAGWLGTWAARGLVRTLRFEYRSLGPVVAPMTAIPPGPRYAYALWHEYLLLPTVALGHPDLAVLISKHADGQILAALIEATGMGTVQGSTNRGGVEAVRQLVKGTAGRRHLVVTPDGPRGPRRIVQPGIVYVASRTGMAVVPVGIGYDRPWRARSWDRFAVPKPCSRVRMVLGEPMAIPAELRSDGLERYRLAVQAEMERLGSAAEHWAATNRLDLPAAPAIHSLRIAG